LKKANANFNIRNYAKKLPVELTSNADIIKLLKTDSTD
jgi:hypothetical protein